MRTRFAHAVAKVTAAATRASGRGQGDALPGLVAERFDPRLAGVLASRLPHGSILITGTNGKTTTTKLVRSALEAAGESVLTNRSGSNLKRGVVSALVRGVGLSGRTPATVGLFEVDEASVRLVAPLIKPRLIVVLNLFRDQLDRYGELETAARLIGEAIAASQAKVVLNADDPLVASLARYAKRPDQVSYFGIDGLPAELATGDRSAVDSDRSPVGGERLEFSRIFYAHLGHYSSPSFDRPQPQVNLTHVSDSDEHGSDFQVSVGGKRYSGRLALPGVYNLYNALAALAAALAVDLEPGPVLTTFATATAAFGRVEEIRWRGRTLVMLLIKNPTGAAQVIETFLVRKERPAVLVAINDRYADGRDVSWLWDVPFERLQDSGAQLTVGGLRGADMALRLKYAGLDCQRHDDLSAALDAFVGGLPEGATGYVLPTYTAMIELRRRLAREAGLAEAGT